LNIFLYAHADTPSRLLFFAEVPLCLLFMLPDYYAVLGVSSNATAEEVKKAFFALALELHPDRTKGDSRKAERFKSITEAYEVLSDRSRRHSYDFNQGRNSSRSSYYSNRGSSTRTRNTSYQQQHQSHSDQWQNYKSSRYQTGSQQAHSAARFSPRNAAIVVGLVVVTAFAFGVDKLIDQAWEVRNGHKRFVPPVHKEQQDKS